MSGSATSSEPRFPLHALDYELPPDRIAQEPVEPRDHARLLVVERSSGRFVDQHVYDLPDWLRRGDLLVLNDTKVIPARLLGSRENTGGRWEGLFLRQLSDGRWELLTQTRGSPKPGEWVQLDQGGVRLRLVEKTSEGHWLVEPEPTEPAEKLLERCGHTPLPPYIRKGREQPGDRERYQTVYARKSGSVAAPTAGMHFTPQLLDRLEAAGVQRTFVTLHVGIGTFQPIQTDDVTRHVMHQEWCEISEPPVEAILGCRRRGGRIVAVGTTSVRVLETVARQEPLRPWRGETDLYIYPPFQFRLVDALMTNFHLPRSSLLALVAAFMGLELMHAAYRHAVSSGYRFYSYGDAMLIV